MYVDLHIHSWYSDGTHSLVEIIGKARSKNITIISICDHELTDVYAEIENAVGIDDITIIPGVEITADMDGVSYHILAYAFDIHNKPLQNLLKHNRSIYVDMGKKLIANMITDFPNLSIEEYQQYRRNCRNGGWDSIAYLTSKGIVRNWENYVKLVAKYTSSAVNKYFSAKEVIDIIHGAGGYAVLAHLCHHVEPDLSEYEKKAMQFYDVGIDGFECYYPEMS
ncbi:MAG: PHP domain-containing protein, partial [Defluviitaleaceae bacterium]|nr:PHP domain-containing protein [Defluviitaleaceae bacterium]